MSGHYIFQQQQLTWLIRTLLKTLLILPVLVFSYLTVKSAVNFFKADELRCLSLNIYHESRNESTAGQIAVGQVVLNRVKSKFFPSNICSVVYQGVHHNGFPSKNRCQFSWYCDGKDDEPTNVLAYNKSTEIAQWLIVSNKWLPDLTDGALFYHANYVSPKWNKTKRKTLQIDHHIFYR